MLTCSCGGVNLEQIEPESTVVINSSRIKTPQARRSCSSIEGGLTYTSTTIWAIIAVTAVLRWQMAPGFICARLSLAVGAVSLDWHQATCLYFWACALVHACMLVCTTTFVNARVLRLLSLANSCIYQGRHIHLHGACAKQLEYLSSDRVTHPAPSVKGDCVNGITIHSLNDQRVGVQRRASQ